MPGHILIAQCPCGFQDWVKPGADGSILNSKVLVIAYDPKKPGLLTVEEQEAKDRDLRTIENPFLKYWRHPMSDPEVQRLGQEPSFVCPKCRESKMHFSHVGFWD